MATALVTGANRGIGLGLVERLVRRGDRVIATVRSLDGARELVALTDDPAAGTLVEIVALDVTDPGSIADLARHLAGRPIDILINSAGVLNSYGGIDDPAHDAAAWAHVLATNVTGPYLVTRALLANLALAKAPKVAFISSSMASSTRAPGKAYPYRASKAAVTNLAVNLATELSPRGIAVAAIDPGWVRTAMGGDGADIDVATSAAGIVARLDALTLATSGTFETYAGEQVAF
ncbi:MAG: SDR family NAD(P)-dependent oxidoreductase [Rhizobiales bacterium]|nr:SDR family NAD(P)-dependent oxidoreductase [Hyphomicrobiales bacterium]